MDSPSAKREREAVDNRDAAFRIVLGAAGSGFMGLREMVLQERTCKEFALSEGRGRAGLRTVAFKEETKGWRVSGEVARGLAVALDAAASADAGASGGFAIARAARAPERACIALAALANNVGELFAAGVPGAQMRMLRREVAANGHARAILCLESVTALLDHKTEFVNNWGPSYAANTVEMLKEASDQISGTNMEVSDALIEAGLLDAISAITATREPDLHDLRDLSCYALCEIKWQSERALPRVEASLLTDLLHFIANTSREASGYELTALTQIVGSHFKKFGANWPEDAPRVSCAAGALDVVVSSRGLSIVAGVVRRGEVLEVGPMVAHLALEPAVGTSSYAKSIAASEELFDALYSVINLDDDGAREYQAFLYTDGHKFLRSHSGYANTTWTTVPDPRIAALEAVTRVVDRGGFPDGSRLRPLVPILTNLLVQTCSPDAQPGPDLFEAREFALALILNLCCTYGLSRAIADAGGADAILAVIKRNRLPGSPAVPELIWKVQHSAWHAILALITTGQLAHLRAAIRSSTIVLPGAPDLSEANGLVENASAEQIARSGTNLQNILRVWSGLPDDARVEDWMSLGTGQPIDADALANLI
jgi:hypothetical protein